MRPKQGKFFEKLVNCLGLFEMQKGVPHGDFYQAGLDCPPFNLPQPLMKKTQFSNGHDQNAQMFLYKIDDIKNTTDQFES